VEQALKRITNDVVISERSSRAVELNKRTAAVKDKCLEMKAVVQRSRTMDRVLVKIREDLDSLDRVMRMKRAEQRQKEATVEIISRRYAEQKQASDELLSRICEIIESVEQHCLAMNAQDERVGHLHPKMALVELGKRAESQETLLADMRHGLNELQAADADAYDELLRIRKDAEHREQHAVDDHPSNVEEARIQWEAEKTHLIAQYSALIRVQKDLHFHIHRGTNIKSTSQLNEFAAQGLVRDVRELRLTLGEMMEANNFTNEEISELEARARVVQRSSRARILQLKDELELSNSLRVQTEEEHCQLLALCNSLQAQVTQAGLANETTPGAAGDQSVGGAVVVTSDPALRTPGSSRRQPSLDTSDIRASVEAAAMGKRPKSLLARLTTPTRAYESCLRNSREEQEYLRHFQEASRRLRPAGCLKPSS
jgi:hypothetical protein